MQNILTILLALSVFLFPSKPKIETSPNMLNAFSIKTGSKILTKIIFCVPKEGKQIE